MHGSAEQIKAKGRALGFSKVAIAAVEHLAEEGAHLHEWLRRGFDGSMAWMKRRASERIDVSHVLQGARSVVCVAQNYYTLPAHPTKAGFGKISRYAWGDDYHRVVGQRLQELWSWIANEYPGAAGKWYVDTGPVMEKAWAQRAGIGWVGKHTNLITKEFGSWVFLGEIVTTLELDVDTAAVDRCGTCDACIGACPTQAITQPYVLDSRRCLSYLTIEHRGDIPEALGRKTTGWIFGCDICQDVCPWNRKFSVGTQDPAFQPRDGFVAPSLEEWACMEPREFESRMDGTPLQRTGFDALQRNIAVARAGENPADPR